MNEQVNNVNNGTGNVTTEGTVVGQPEPIPVATEQQKIVVVQKEEGWLKRHWKGVTASAAALITAATSAFVAYKKGSKAGYNTGFQNGVNSIPNNEYSLNPNVEE